MMHTCTYLRNTPQALAKHALVVESSVTPVPASTDLLQLAPLGCGIQTGSGAVINILKPEQPELSSIVVFGVGAVGLSAVFAAKALGFETIIVVDLVQSRLDLAKSLGVTHAFSGKAEGQLLFEVSWTVTALRSRPLLIIAHFARPGRDYQKGDWYWG